MIRRPPRSTLFPYTRSSDLDGFAAWLAARGVVKGDRVALVMPNCPQVIIAQLGVWKAGAVAVPLNPLSSEERSEEHTSELQSRLHLVCRLLLEKKKKKICAI